MPNLLTLHRGHIYEITLNRPEKRNAMHWPLLQELAEAIEQAERTPEARVILLGGAGPGFSAGIDLQAFADLSSTFGDNWQGRMPNITAAFQTVLNRVERSALPVIAMLHGYALGLGLELALACDFRLAAHGTKLGLPETRLGILPDVGGTTRLTRLIGPARAKELILTGRTFDDLELAERWGLITTATNSADLLPRAEVLAAEIAQAAPLAVSYAKQVINGLTDVERGLQLEGWAQNHLIQTEDFQTGVQSLLRRAAPEWHGR